jgi:DNA-binding IscR family transcriptional regulator
MEIEIKKDDIIKVLEYLRNNNNIDIDNLNIVSKCLNINKEILEIILSLLKESGIIKKVV